MISPSEFPKEVHSTSTKHPKYPDWNSLKFYTLPTGKKRKKTHTHTHILFPPLNQKKIATVRSKGLSSGHGSYQSTVAQLMREGNLGSWVHQGGEHDDRYFDTPSLHVYGWNLAVVNSVSQAMGVVLLYHLSSTSKVNNSHTSTYKVPETNIPI